MDINLSFIGFRVYRPVFCLEMKSSSTGLKSFECDDSGTTKIPTVIKKAAMIKLFHGFHLHLSKIE